MVRDGENLASARMVLSAPVVRQQGVREDRGQKSRPLRRSLWKFPFKLPAISWIVIEAQIQVFNSIDVKPTLRFKASVRVNIQEKAH
jgi:hypothetical protein